MSSKRGQNGSCGPAMPAGGRIEILYDLSSQVLNAAGAGYVAVWPAGGGRIDRMHRLPIQELGAIANAAAKTTIITATIRKG